MSMRNMLGAVRKNTTKAPKQRPSMLDEAERALRRSIPGHKRTNISSHPEADPEGLVPSEAGVDLPVQEDFHPPSESNRPKPIVSIHGTDVENDEEDREAA